jgi:hypothetical protein
MSTCPVCGDLLTADVVVCALCGTNLTLNPSGDWALLPAEQRRGDGAQWEIFDDSPPAPPSAAPALPVASPAAEPVSYPQALPIAALATPAQRCLVLYGPNKTPLHRFPLQKDVTVIGRRDPMRGNFPDIDVAEWLGESAARSVSRKHALLLHTRADDSFALRPLAGNTGTQIEQDMVEPLRDYPLKPGFRLILGGAVRFKFEIGS